MVWRLKWGEAGAGRDERRENLTDKSRDLLAVVTMTNSDDAAANEPLLTDDSNPRALYHEEYKPPFLPALMILPFLLPFFWKYSVTCTDDERVAFGYSTSYTRQELHRSGIVQVSPIDHINGLTEWGGWGIRMNLRGEIGYIVTNGPAVRVEMTGESGGKTYVFNCKEPQKLCDLLTTNPTK
jgi:hypothetical protein